MTSSLPMLFAARAALAAALGTIAVWAPRKLVAKLVALALFAALLPLGFAGWSDLLSRPKPVTLEWLYGKQDEATVLAGSFEEGRGIFVWLQIDGAEEPRAYSLPWSQEQAQQLQQAMRDAQSNGTGVRMRTPFEPTLDPREPRFYATPQPALPPKDGGREAPPVERFVQTQQDV